MEPRRSRPPRWIRTLALGSTLALGVAAASLAQVPPHPPGTVCYTPTFWCIARPAGPPGSPCVCFSPAGPVGGVRG